MKTSDSITKFAPAFVKAQAQVSGASKDCTNPAFKSKYANLESVTDAIRPAAAQHGLAYLQDATMIDGQRLLLTTRIIHESGEWIDFEMTMPISKVDPQGFGSSVTYGRRYALSAAFGVAPEDDDGNAASGSSSGWTKPSTPAPASAAKPATPAPVPAKPAVIPVAPVAVKPAAPTLPPENLVELLECGEEASKLGLAGYRVFWTALPGRSQSAVGVAQHEKWKAAASLVKAAA